MRSVMLLRAWRWRSWLLSRPCRPEDGQIAAWHSPQSKMRYLNSSIQTILDNPDAAFAVDPNGFVIITGKVCAPGPPAPAPAW